MRITERGERKGGVAVEAWRVVVTCWERIVERVRGRSKGAVEGGIGHKVTNANPTPRKVPSPTPEGPHGGVRFSGRVGYIATLRAARIAQERAEGTQAPSAPTAEGEPSEALIECVRTCPFALCHGLGCMRGIR